MALSTAQREAIRSIHDGTQMEHINKRTMASLVSRNLTDGTTLTIAGHRAYQQIMSSGNGPERLKAMFRF
jgi:hypothetical protein